MKSIKRKKYTRKKRTKKRYNKGGVHTDLLHLAETEHAITGHHPIFPKDIGDHNFNPMEFYKSVKRTLGIEKTMDEFQRELSTLPAKTQRRKSPPKTQRRKSPPKTQRRKSPPKTQRRKTPTPTLFDIVEASILG